MTGFLLRSAGGVARHCTRSAPMSRASALSSSFTPQFNVQPHKAHCGLRPRLRFASVRTTALAVGDKIPGSPKFNYFDHDGNMQQITAEDLTKGKKVVLLGVPGAFTPTCSSKHVPGFLDKADELKAKGVDTIACTSVNDAFVMDAWSKSLGAEDKIQLLADGSAEFAKALGIELDLSDKGLGVRSRRYAMLLDDGVVKELNLEEGGAFTVSGVDGILKAL